MAYTKKVWKDAPDTSTPINAANLNHMEDGIATADVNAQNALDRLDDVDDEITQINSDLTAFTNHATQVGISNTPMTASADGWFCVYGRSASGNFVEVLDGASPMWSGFIYSDGSNGSCSPLLIGRAGHTYTINVVSGGSYDTHFVVYR